MVKGRKEKDDGGGGPSSEEQESIRESKRLRELAVSRGLLSRSKANPVTPLLPTKTIRKCDGKDIVKKGNRKTKYLFAFPGLVAPVAGGKLGELTHLDSRNPVFYIDFPQGRLKLFGTIVYPKNKYLTMHFAPGRGDIVCEECFESIVSFDKPGILPLRILGQVLPVVFPEAWWIGTKEENPEELRLPMPSNLQQEKHTDSDFKGGAGRPPSLNDTPGVNQVATVKNDPPSPEQQFTVGRLQESPSSMEIVVEEDLPLRRSSRKSAEKLNYATMLSSSSDCKGSGDSDSDHSDFRRKGRRERRTNKNTMQSTSSLPPTGAAIEDKVHENGTEPTKRKTSQEVEILQGSITKDAPKGPLRQATLSSFLSKTEKSQAPSVQVIEIEDSPLKVESGGNRGNSERPRRAATKTFVEEESEDAQSSEDGQSSSDSVPTKNIGNRRGRGRGRASGGRNAATSGGRTSTPRKGDATRRHSITESSDD